MKPKVECINPFFAEPEPRVIREGTGAIFWGFVALVIWTVVIAFICGGVCGWYMRGCM